MTTESRRVSRDVAVVKGHAWKAIRASGTDARRNTSSSKWFNNLSPQNAPRCDAVDSVFIVSFEPTLHSSYTPLGFACSRVLKFFGTARFSGRAG